MHTGTVQVLSCNFILVLNITLPALRSLSDRQTGAPTTESCNPHTHAAYALRVLEGKCQQVEKKKTQKKQQKH